MFRLFWLALFGFFVAGVTLYRLLGDRQPPGLDKLKRFFGRKPALVLFFVINVALPVTVGMVFLGRGVAEFQPRQWNLAPLEMGQVRRLLQQAGSAQLHDLLSPSDAQLNNSSLLRAYNRLLFP